MANIYVKTDNPLILLLQIRGNKNDGDIFIDKQDYDKIKNSLWYVKDSTNSNPKGYVAAKINKKTVKLHRFLLDTTDRKVIIDHKNRNPWDNTQNNLRKTDYSQNNLNITLSRNNTTGKTGLLYMKATSTSKPKWYCQIRVNGKTHSKYFSVGVYGEKQAKQNAIDCLHTLKKQFNVLSE